MAIRFRLEPYDLDRVAFAYSPALEAILSLHVLTHPKHHPLQHPWVRGMRRLPPSLKREIAAFGFVYHEVVPDVFLPRPDDDFQSFDAELARLRSLDEETVAYEFTRTMWDHGGGAERDMAWVADAEIRGHIVRLGAEKSAGSSRAVKLALDEPATFAVRLADVLAAYWDAAFAEEWERLEPELAECVTAAGRELAEHGIYSLLESLPRRLRVDRRASEFGIDVPHEHRVDLAAENETLVFVPSAYVWPHVRVNCDAPWPRTIIYAAPFASRGARPELPPEELVRVLRAAGDQTRLQALRLIAQRPRSTQELAPLVGITEAGLSKHLRQLADAGLVTTKREGYYVLYSLASGRLAALGDAVLDFVSVPGPEEVPDDHGAADDSGDDGDHLQSENHP
jgi:DNA-binding transcriptional ArsR family regulator